MRRFPISLYIIDVMKENITFLKGKQNETKALF